MKVYVFSFYDNDIHDVIHMEFYYSKHDIVKFIKNSILYTFEEEFDEDGDLLDTPIIYTNNEIDNIIKDFNEKIDDPKFDHWSLWLKQNHRLISVFTKELSNV